MSLRYTDRLREADAALSVGTVGDAYDNGLMESPIGLFKTEIIEAGGLRWTLGDVEIAP
ncbi:hypothetical protein [Streptomyces sp. NPDC093707]|uniref:hypothetical protein n=1 Tax=Streptomyces sp. NPDC093707 TaxID=3154984 RepID=UPI00344D1843